MRFHQIQAPALAQVSVIQPPRMRTARFIPRVPSPVRRDNVELPVSIHVARRHSIPPSHILSQPQLLRLFLILSFPAPPIHPHRSPLARQHQLGAPVSVQIAPHRPAHQPHFLQPLPHHQPASLVLHQERRRRLGISPGNHPSAHKQIQIPVSVHVPQRQRPPTPALSHDALPGDLPLEIVDPHTPAIGLSVLVVARSHEQRPLQTHHSRLVPTQHAIKRRFVQHRKSSLPVVPIHSNHPSLPAPDHQILPSVPVHILPAHPGPQLA